MKVLLFCFIYNYLGDDIILRLIIKGTKFYYNTKLSRQQIMDYSSEMFRKTIKHAYRESRFYHKYYRDNGIKYRDLDNIPIEEIPMVSKDQVRENFYDIATKPINPKRVERAVESSKLVARVGRDFLVHTSGSTGTPCNFLYDRKAVTAIESNFIRLSIGGKNPVGWSDLPVKSVYIAPVGNGYACTALALNGLKSYHARGYVLDASKPLSEWKNVLSKYSPNYLSGYPSCLSMIAPMQEKGEINFHPKKIITGGEPITHESAVYFSKLFNSDIIDYYGCTESILLGAGGSSKELGIIPPRSARPYKLNFDKKNLKVDKISPDDWKIGFDTRLQAKSYADIEFEGIPDGISEENRFVLDTFLKGLPRIERGQISFSKFNLALTPEGEFDISIVIRNGADKGINIERIPVKLKDDNDNTVFAAEFQLKDLTVSSNKARLVNLKAQSNLTSTGTVDLNGCKLLFEK